MKNITKLFFLALIMTTIFLGLSSPAKAAFYSNDVMDDSVFDNVNSMSAPQIDNWINTNFPNSCISTNNGFRFPDPTGYSPVPPYYTYGADVSAGQVIADAAQAYGLNPQVIIATLEKESSVVTGNASYHCTYINTAMGYDCWDVGACPRNSATESGFSKQIIHAAWMLKFHQQRSLGNTAWNVQLNNLPQPGDHWDNSDDPATCYSGRMTEGNRQICSGGATSYYDGLTTIDGVSVHLDTGATAALYDYTPHFHGNQLFVSLFEQWFGATVGELVRTPTNGTVYLLSGTTKYPIADANVLNDYSVLGPLRYVTDSYAVTLTTGPVLTHMIRSPDGSLYFVNANIKLPFTSCSGDVIDYGYTCAQALDQFANLTDTQVNKLRTGPAVTSLIKSNSNGTLYYMSVGAKRPIPSWNDLTSLHIALRWNVFSDTLTNQFPVGSLLYGPGNLVKTANSGTVYVTKSISELLPISSFIYPQGYGMSANIRTISASDYTILGTPLENKISCNSINYIGTNGTAYPASGNILTTSRYASGYIDGGGICANLRLSSQALDKYIRTSDGSIYFINNSGQKQGFSSYAAYLSSQSANGNPGYISVDNFFADTIPSGPNI